VVVSGVCNLFDLSTGRFFWDAEHLLGRFAGGAFMPSGCSTFHKMTVLADSLPSELTLSSDDLENGKLALAILFGTCLNCFALNP
jgi:hypothetical protein